jgi:hypothetical protein
MRKEDEMKLRHINKSYAIMPYAIKSSMSMVLARFWSNLLSTRMAWVLSFRLNFSGITFEAKQNRMSRAITFSRKGKKYIK